MTELMVVVLLSEGEVLVLIVWPGRDLAVEGNEVDMMRAQ